MEKIRIGIMGYGNLGRGVELAVRQNPDMELSAFFTRRNPEDLKTLSPNVPVYNVADAAAHKDAVDVLVICGGSATDLPKQTPEYAKYFNVVDSFDTHARIPEHFAACDKAAKEASHVAFISIGWDPGMFSLQRLLGNCILPDGADYTFWGKGVSQGHSDAIRRIPGVLDAKQYTIPVEDALNRVRSGENPTLTTRESTPVSALLWHRRGRIWQPLSGKSLQCPTILPTMIPRFILFPWRKCAGITAASPTAAL